MPDLYSALWGDLILFLAGGTQMAGVLARRTIYCKRVKYKN